MFYDVCAYIFFDIFYKLYKNLHIYYRIVRKWFQKYNMLLHFYKMPNLQPQNWVQLS